MSKSTMDRDKLKKQLKELEKSTQEQIKSYQSSIMKPAASISQDDQTSNINLPISEQQSSVSKSPFSVKFSQPAEHLASNDPSHYNSVMSPPLSNRMHSLLSSKLNLMKANVMPSPRGDILNGYSPRPPSISNAKLEEQKAEMKAQKEAIEEQMKEVKEIVANTEEKLDVTIEEIGAKLDERFRAEMEK